MIGLKRADFIKNEYSKFFTRVKELDYTKTKQITRFVEWCFDNRFLDGMTIRDLNVFYEDDCICLPRMIHSGIEILFIHYKVKGNHVCMVGIEPGHWCGEISDCSIAMKFPFSSKREEDRFYRLLNAILDRKTATSKEWFDRKNKTWSGKYMTNM